MTNKLLAALYISLIVGMFILLTSGNEIGWVFFGFLFVAVFGGILVVNRPGIIALGFLIASLIVFGVGVFSRQSTLENRITIVVGASMSALSVFTLIWVFMHPEPPITPVSIDKGYDKMDDQEFLHQVSVDYDVNIELLKDLYQNKELWSLIRAGKLIDATVLLRSIQPKVGLREANRVVKSFSARNNG